MLFVGFYTLFDKDFTFGHYPVIIAGNFSCYSLDRNTTATPGPYVTSKRSQCQVLTGKNTLCQTTEHLTCIVMSLHSYTFTHFTRTGSHWGYLQPTGKMFSVGHAVISVPTSLTICKKLY